MTVLDFILLCEPGVNIWICVNDKMIAEVDVDNVDIKDLREYKSMCIESIDWYHMPHVICLKL